MNRNPTTPPPEDAPDHTDKEGANDPAPQGEGNYAAARRYRKSAEQFARSGQVEKAARDAEPADEEEQAELRDAEVQGLRHAKE